MPPEVLLALQSMPQNLVHYQKDARLSISAIGEMLLKLKLVDLEHQVYLHTVLSNCGSKLTDRPCYLNHTCRILQPKILLPNFMYNFIIIIHSIEAEFCNLKVYFLILCITLLLERFSLDCRKTKTKVNTLANQRA